MMKRIITVVMSIMFLLTCFTSCKKTINAPDEERIKMICELTTVKAYYNNLAKSTKPKDDYFSKDREFWVEFEGCADIGFDMELVKIEISNDKVSIILPKATILDTRVISKSFDDDSVITSSDGFLFKNKISTDDLNEAVNKAQKEMEETVSNNKYLFDIAESRAKELIENYINKLGEISGIDYEIVWKTIDSKPTDTQE